MNKKNGFSLAEAMITLLIVCIIAIVSAPMMTKKAKKTPEQALWRTDAPLNTAVYPNAGMDIKLGDLSSKNQSIVVVGTLYFKDSEGKVIGWIKEDGTNSFAGQTGMLEENQQRIMETVARLNNMLNEMKQNDNRIHPGRSSRQNNRNQPPMSESDMQRELMNLINAANRNGRQ